MENEATIPDPVLSAVIEHVRGSMESSIARLIDVLRIPSISTDPQYAAEVHRAASWCSAQLAEIGFQCKLIESAGFPIVLAQTPGGSSRAPRVLYYGHYDVQPVDPLELWESPPFEPRIIGGPHGKRIVARGAADNKGQFMTFVEAIRAWRAVHGSLPINATILLEGQEESGSVALSNLLRSNPSWLSADVCVVSDTAMWDAATPAIINRVRGLLYAEATLHGPSADLHSGMWGGAVVNPATALVRAIAALHDDSGRVQLPGFYDAVRPLSKEERAGWKQVPFNEAAFLARAGVTQSDGERGYTLLERMWARPTCEVNGIYGGYGGPGAKTIIPGSATAKISFRLVEDQNPQEVYRSLVAFLKARAPASCRWEISNLGSGNPMAVSLGSRYLRAAMSALSLAFGKDPVLVGSGGSVPIAALMKQYLGVDTILMGFALDDDRVHSPNEKFELTSFERGIIAHAALLNALRTEQHPDKNGEPG